MKSETEWKEGVAEKKNMILFGAILSQLSMKEVWTIMENRDLKHFMVEFLLQTRGFYKKSDCFHRVLGVPLRIAFVLDM